MLDADALERILIQAARQRATLSYRQLLAMGGRRVGPNNVRALMRVLSEVCQRTKARGEPDLACLVVREKDGLPGDGYFASESALSPTERSAHIADAQERAFAFWAAQPAAP